MKDPCEDAIIVIPSAGAEQYMLLPLDRLVKASWNYKTDDLEKKEKLKAGIKRNGQIVNCIVRELPTGFYEVVNGNHRFDAFLELGILSAVCCNLGPISLAQAQRIAVETNEVWFESDPDRLAALMREIREEFSLEDLLSTMPYSEAEFGEFLSAIDELPTASFDEVPEPEIERAAELQQKWGTETGQLWLIGPHRLLCGDSTEAADVDLVMQGELTDMIFTDPPYGVEYVGKTKQKLTIQNDNLGNAGTRALVADALSVAPLRPGASFYICSPAGETETFFRLAIDDAGLAIRQCLVWVKQQFVLGRQDYHWRHESILYGWKDGAAHYFLDDRTQDTVWEIDRPSRNGDHPTMKPVELVAKAIGNSSRPGQIVFDGFGGSGSTLAACQIGARVGRSIEKDPKYVAVILERLQQMGLQPSLSPSEQS